MPHAPSYATLFLVAVTATMPTWPAAAAGEALLPLTLAQAPPPEESPPAATDAEEPPPQDKKQQRQEQIEQRREIQKQRKEERKEERQQRQQERVRERQEESERLQQERTQQQQERQEQQRARQEQLKEQLRQKQEADRAEKQQQDERLRQERVRQQELDDQQRQQREAERDRLQQEKDRQREKRQRQDQVKEQPPEGTAPQVQPEGEGKAGRPAEAKDVPQNEPAAARREERRRVRKEVLESYRRAPRQERSIDELKRNRRERSVIDGKLRVIEEPDRRVIVKQDDRTFIRHDESERFRRLSPDARTIRRADGTTSTFITRRGGIRIYDVTDRHGRLLYRYRRYPDGREVVLIDNRRYYRRDRNRTRDVLIGAGIGLAIGGAIALAAPDVRIPRDEYIVDYGRASDEDLYEALTAPPVERLDRGYSLEEIRYSRHLRDRMRRIDLDTVTFDFGSWEVGPDQSRALDRLADGILRVLERNPDEIFMIEGHTDAVGSEEDNLTLSDRRAQSVAEILTTEYGVPPENLVTQGYGEEQLKIPTDGPERANRRITVRRIGPLLSGRFDDDRYRGGDRSDGGGGGGSYDYDRDRYDDRP